MSIKIADSTLRFLIFTLIASLFVIIFVTEANASTTFVPTLSNDIFISDQYGSRGADNALVYGDGKYLGVWNDNSVVIKGRFISTDGTGGNIFTINNWGYDLSAAYGGGKFIVAYFTQFDNGNTPAVVCKFLSTDGTVGNDIIVDQSSRSFSSTSVASNNYGEFLVVWRSYSQVDLKSHIYGRLISSAGDFLSPVFQITPDGKYQNNPVVTSDGEGYFIVYGDGITYTGTGDTNNNVYGVRVSRSGIVLDSNGIAICTAPGSQEYGGGFGVAYNGNCYIASWRDCSLSAHTRLFAARISHDGVLLDGPVDSGGILVSDDMYYPSRIACDGTDFLLVYTTYNGVVNGIVGKRMDTNGQLIDSSPIPLSMTRSTVDPCVAYDGKNYMVSAIISEYFANNVYKHTVYGQIISKVSMYTVDDSYYCSEDSYVSSNFLSNDFNGDGYPWTISITRRPVNGVLTYSNDGQFTYTPNPNYFGSDSFVYEANDGHGGVDDAAVSVTINGRNDVPVATSDSYSVDKNQILNVPAPGLLANDFDVDGDTLSASRYSSPTHGTVTISTDGAFVYTPNVGYSGSDSFRYFAYDKYSNSAPATVSITVNPVNDPPVAVNDMATTKEGVPITINVLANDNDPNGNQLTALLVAGPAHGSITQNLDGTFTYTPEARFSGSDGFTYKANDGLTDSNIASVTITVQSVNPPEFLVKWAPKDPVYGVNINPASVAIDSAGNVYVGDDSYSSIQKFDHNGQFLAIWGIGGSGDGQFNSPDAIAFNSSGYMYVVEYNNYRVQILDPDGKFVGKWGSRDTSLYGTLDGQFKGPIGIAIDASDNVYVLDGFNNKIQKFDSNGKFLFKWGSGGSGNGQFNGPQGITINSKGYIYVADSYNNRVQKFDLNGNFVSSFGSNGAGDGQFSAPYGITTDSSDNIYVSERSNNRVQKFSSDGTFLTKWGSAGSGDGQFNFPYGIAVSDDGNVYVTEVYGCRIQKFGVSPKVELRPAQQSVTQFIPISVTSGVNQVDALNAIDGDVSTYWQASTDFGTSQWIKFDLGEVIQVAGFRETSGYFSANPIKVYVSSDDISYTLVDSSLLTYSRFGDHILSSPVNARYIKMELIRTDNTGDGKIAEFQVLVPGDRISINYGDTLKIAGDIIDLSTHTWTATVDYGDGTGVQNLFLYDSTYHKFFNLDHKYARSGVFTITVKAINNEGGVRTDTLTVNVIGIDDIPPVTTCTLSGTSGTNGWNTSNVQVTLTAVDNVGGSGVQLTEYSLDGTNWNTYTAPFSVSNEGITTVYYHSKDNKNIQETTKTQTIKIDKTAPVISGTPTTPANANGWYKSDVTVHFTASDSGSGISRVTPDTKLSTQGTGQSVTGSAVDQAGNTASFTVSGINIDKTPPVLTGAANTNPNANGWYKSDVIVVFTCSDSMSGIAVSPSDVTITAEGAGQAATATATDKAGNSVTVTIGGINIDKTLPVISGTPTTSANMNGWYKTDVTVHFTVADTGSGIDTVTPDTTISSEGANQQTIGIVMDKAGNSASYTATGINIDKTAPTISGAATTSPNENSWYNTDVTVKFTTADTLSGVASATQDAVLSEEKAGQSVTGTVMDKAGNTASTTISGINIDKTAPTISGSRNPSANSYCWNNEDVTVSFTAGDSLSGVASVTPATTVSTEGANQAVTGTVVDKAGNTASATVSGINIDKTAPVIIKSRSPEPNTNGWSNVDVTARFEASDTLSGIGGSPIQESKISSEGTDITASAIFTDLAGNSATAIIDKINIDKTLPTITYTRTLDNNYDWNNGDVTVTFTGEDKISGVASITQPKTLTVEGAGQTVTGIVTDKAGNTASVTVDNINIDKTVPTITYTRNLPNQKGWYNTPAYFVFTGEDALSGIAADSAPVKISTEGVNQVASGTTWDKAGNIASVTIDNINIDMTAPTIQGTTMSQPNANGWYNNDVVIHFTASDIGSGVASITPDITFAREGKSLSFTGTVYDLAGNWANAMVGNLNIDKTAPVTRCSVSGTISNGRFVPSATFTFDSTDQLSGVNRIEYSIDGEAWITYTTPVVLATPGFHTIRYRGIDNAGNVEREQSDCENIGDTTPTVGTINTLVTPVPVNTQVYANAIVSDPGNDIVSTTWDWDDGTTSSGQLSDGTASATHTYMVAGVYTVKLTVTDSSGAIGQNTYEYVVVYDPNGGFVTGGGWIDSPAGAYYADPTIAGKATFGFVSKYVKSATIPTGSTEFQFRLANMNFKSTSYDWLVIAGARAQYKGTGTINGAGDYWFILTAVDGQVNGGGGVDKFRIKIWDKATGEKIFDNQFWAADTASLTTSLSGGSIVVHK